MQAPIPQPAKALILLAAIAALAPAQQPAKTPRRFDVVSVKPVGRGQRSLIGPDCSAAGFRSGIPVRLAVAFAYDYVNLLRDGILDGPDWRAISGNEYEIAARSDQPIGQDKCKQTIEQLLAERSKLALHREAKEEALYALVVARGGPKFREVQDAQDKAASQPSTGSRCVLLPYRMPQTCRASLCSS
jgi:uncharacterized protein (TIGR03435 family)